MILYHGSYGTVEFPEIRKARFHKDFYFGFIVRSIRSRQSGGQLDMEKMGILINTNIYRMKNLIICVLKR